MRYLTGIVLICGVVAMLGAGCVPIWAIKKRAVPPVTTTPPAAAPVADPAAALPASPVATPTTPVPQAPASQPGIQAALEAARAAKPGWTAEVHNHSADWSTVEVKVGPSHGNWQTGLNYRWTFRGYELTSEGPWNPPPPTTVIIQQQAPPKTVIVKQRPPQAKPPSNTIPVKARQGAARATARRQFSGQASTTKILSVSSQWRSVRVQVSNGGKPVGVVSMTWSDSSQSYNITGVQRF